MDFIYNLKEIQEKFSNYIYNLENSNLINEVTPKDNLVIYKDSIFHTQIDALNAIFVTTSEYLSKNPHNYDLNYNLLYILDAFVKNIPCQFENYYQYAEIFISFLEEIELTPNIEYLSDIAKLDLIHSQLLNLPTNKIPDYSILQNLNNLDFRKVILSAPETFKIINLDFDLINFWNNYINNKNFSKDNIIKKSCFIFIAPYSNEISTTEISESIYYFLSIFKNRNISLSNLSNIFIEENKHDFESCFLDAIQLKLVNINYED